MRFGGEDFSDQFRSFFGAANGAFPLFAAADEQDVFAIFDRYRGGDRRMGANLPSAPFGVFGFFESFRAFGFFRQAAVYERHFSLLSSVAFGGFRRSCISGDRPFPAFVHFRRSAISGGRSFSGFRPFSSGFRFGAISVLRWVVWGVSGCRLELAFFSGFVRSAIRPYKVK